MSFCVVSGQPVFLHDVAYKMLEDDIFADYSALDLMGTRFDKEYDKTVAKMCIRLKEYQSQDSTKFENEWVYFDLIDEEARLNLPDLLFDHCDYYGRGKAQVTQASFDNFITAINDPNAAHKIFQRQLMNLSIPIESKWRSQISSLLLSKREAAHVNLQFRTASVRRLKGKLDSFIIECDHYAIQLSENVSYGPMPLRAM